MSGLNPGAAPYSAKDLGRRLKWIEDRLKYLGSARALLERGSVSGGVTTIREILTNPGQGREFWEDSATAATDGAPVEVALQFLPRPHSEHVYWGPLYQPASEWTRDGLVLTFNDPNVKTGDVITVEYAYDPTDADAVPGPVITSPAAGSSTGDTTPTISGTAAPLRDIEVFVDGVSVGTTTSAADGTWMVTVASALSLGSHTITATQTNLDLTTSDADPVSFAVTSPSPAAATLRGGRTARGAGSPALDGFALPAGTVVGDLIAFSATGSEAANLLVSDSRLTHVGGGLWVGFATTLADIAVTAALGKYWAIACITLDTDAVAWTAASVVSEGKPSGVSTITVGTVSGVGVAVCSIVENHSVVDGQAATPAGYTEGASADPGKQHARVDFWTNATLATSPAAESIITGGTGTTTATVIGLIGP